MPGPTLSQKVLPWRCERLDLRSSRAGLSFAVSDDTRNNKIRIIHGSTKGYSQGIAQFPAFMDSTRRFGIYVTAKTLDHSGS